MKERKPIKKSERSVAAAVDLFLSELLFFSPRLQNQWPTRPPTTGASA